MDHKWSVEQKSENVHIIRITYNGSLDQRVLLSADRHHDSVKALWKLEKKHLDQALAYDAPIIDAGDLFDAMQGKGDRRGVKADLRDEYKKEDYLDALIEEAESFYGPYKEQFAVIGRGNHDSAIIKYHETDITRRFCRRIGCYVGGYRGWVRFLFEHESGGRRQSVTLHYTHGPGGSGGGEVTKGTIKSARRAAYLPDADIVMSGHIHESWIMEIPRWRLNEAHNLYLDTQYHIQLPTYKQEFETGATGWVNEREMPPKPIGAWWLKFRFEEGRIRFGFERAD